MHSNLFVTLPGADVLHTVIHVNGDLVRAQMARQSIFAYDRTSTGAQDYQHVVQELLGTRRTVESRGTVLPFRHPRRGPGSRKAPKSGRAAQADSLEPVGFTEVERDCQGLDRGEPSA
jgi:hypothetical protein